MKSNAIFRIIIFLSIVILAFILSVLTIRILDINYKYDKYENKNPKVSVVMPVYNAEKTIGQALECLTKQTLKDIEIICINDGSKDKSLNILKQWAKKHNNIRIYSQKNKGAGAARNRGLDLANGKYIIFLDADDLFKHKMLEKLYTKATQTKSEIVIFEYDEMRSYDNVNLEITNWKNLNSRLITKNIFTYKDLGKNIFAFTYFQSWNKFYLRDFLVKNDIRFQEIRYFEDLDFVYSSLIIAKRISVLYDKLLLYRNLQTTKTLSKYGKRTKGYFGKAFTKLQQSIKEKSDWEYLKRNYINQMAEIYFIEYHNTKIQYNNKNDQKEIITNNSDNLVQILKDIGIKDLKQNYFYSKKTYLKLRAMLVLYGIQI